MGLIDFVKTNKEKIGDYETVTDLDSIIESKVAFKFKGKYHEIKPISLKTFILVIEAMSQAEKLLNKKEATNEDVVNYYYQLISSCCDTITKEDIQEMTTVQLAALVKVIMNLISGGVELEKKKLTDLETHQHQQK